MEVVGEAVVIKYLSVRSVTWQQVTFHWRENPASTSEALGRLSDLLGGEVLPSTGVRRRDVRLDIIYSPTISAWRYMLHQKRYRRDLVARHVLQKTLSKKRTSSFINKQDFRFLRRSCVLPCLFCKSRLENLGSGKIQSMSLCATWCRSRHLPAIGGWGVDGICRSVPVHASQECRVAWASSWMASAGLCH